MFAFFDRDKIDIEEANEMVHTFKKDILVKYEFNTTDEHGNKVMDKMSREETLQAMKDIGSQYGDAVIVEFSDDGQQCVHGISED